MFDDGVPRPTHVKNAITAEFLVPGPPGLLFGVQSVPGDFFVFSVSPSGITQTPFYSLVNGYPYQMVRQADRLYANSGEVVDVSNPAAPVKAPSFAYGGPVAVRDVGKLLMLTTDMFTDPFHPTAALRILAMDTRSEITSLPLPASIAPNFSTSYGGLVYAGGDAVAFFRTERGIVDRLELVIMHDPAIATATGGAGGAGGAAGAAGMGGIGGGGGVAGTGGAPTDPCPGCTFTTVAGAYGRQLAYDPSRNLVYVAAYGEAQMNANTIVTVDVSTAAVTSVVPVGSNPQVLALSDDNTTMWVGLTGNRQVRRLTAGATPVAGTAYAMPMITRPGLTEQSYARSIAVLPGTPSSIAVSAFGTQFGTAVFILDEGVLRANYTQLPSIDIDLLVNGPPGYLFGIDGVSSFFAIRLGATGATHSRHGGLLQSINQTKLVYSGNNVYATIGEVIDVSNPDMPLPAGRYSLEPCPLAIRSPSRVLRLCTNPTPGGPILRVLDTANFAPTGSVTLPTSLQGTLWLDFAYLGGDAVALLPYQGPLQIMRAPVIGNPP